MKSRLFPIVLTLSLAACAQSDAPASAAADASPDADAEAAQATASVASTGALSAEQHVLTRANVDAFFAVQPNFAAAVEGDPELDPAMNLSEEDTAAYAARLEGTPALRAAIVREGISVRDYALTSEALLGALMAQGALDAGLLQELPEGLNPQHVEFVRTHKAEIEAKVRSMQGSARASED